MATESFITRIEGAAKATAGVELAIAKALELLQRPALHNGHGVFTNPTDTLSRVREAGAHLMAASELANRVVWPTTEDFESFRMQAQRNRSNHHGAQHQAR